MNTEERRARIKAAKEENDQSMSRSPAQVQADALIVIADVLTELADGVKWCGHGYIQAICPHHHEPHQ